MIKLKSYSLFRPVVLYFLVLYIIGIICNMVFIPRYSRVFTCKTGIELATQKVYKLHAHLSELNNLKIIDKSTLENDEHGPMVCLLIGILLSFIGFCLYPFAFKPVALKSPLPGLLRPAYLCFCTFRI